MTRAALLMLLVIAAVILAACQSERFSQCDPSNTPARTLSAGATFSEPVMKSPAEG